MACFICCEINIQFVIKGEIIKELENISELVEILWVLKPGETLLIRTSPPTHFLGIYSQFDLIIQEKDIVKVGTNVVQFTIFITKKYVKVELWKFSNTLL